MPLADIAQVQEGEATSTEGTAETEDETAAAMYNTLVSEGVAEGHVVAQVENTASRGGGEDERRGGRAIGAAGGRDDDKEESGGARGRC